VEFVAAVAVVAEVVVEELVEVIVEPYLDANKLL
jgi:hypothetical protein